MATVSAKPPNQDQKKEKLPVSVYILFFALIIDLLGFTVILPLLPSILDHYSNNENDFLYHWMDKKVQFLQMTLGSPRVFNKVLFGGLLGSLFCSLQFLITPIMGSLSDVYGRKPVLILSMIGIGLSYSIWSISDFFYLFVISRIIGGISRTNISLSTAVITDLCSEKIRSKGMALIGIAFSVGFMVGPMIGAIFASYKDIQGANFYVLPAIFAMTMALLYIILISCFFTESLPKNKRAASIGHGLSEAYQFISPVSLFSFSPVQRIKPSELNTLRKIGVIYFIFLFIYSGLEFTLGFLTHQRFMFSSMQQGKMYLFTGIIMIFVQGLCVRRVPPGKELILAAIGAFLIIPSFILIGLSRGLKTLYLGLSLYAFASASVVPCLTIIASKLGTGDQKGTVLGIFRALGSLARAFGPVVFAFAYWGLTAKFSYCLGGFLLVIPFLLILKLKKDSTMIKKVE